MSLCVWLCSTRDVGVCVCLVLWSVRALSATSQGQGTGREEERCSGGKEAEAARRARATDAADSTWNRHSTTAGHAWRSAPSPLLPMTRLLLELAGLCRRYWLGSLARGIPAPRVDVLRRRAPFATSLAPSLRRRLLVFDCPCPLDRYKQHSGRPLSPAHRIAAADRGSRPPLMRSLSPPATAIPGCLDACCPSKRLLGEADYGVRRRLHSFSCSSDLPSRVGSSPNRAARHCPYWYDCGKLVQVAHESSERLGSRRANVCCTAAKSR